jgi:hypothetical protein
MKDGDVVHSDTVPRDAWLAAIYVRIALDVLDVSWSGHVSVSLGQASGLRLHRP